MKKRISAFLLVMALTLSFVPLTAMSAGLTITAATPDTVFRIGDTVSVPVTISGNPGFWGMALKVKYDTTALELVEFSKDSPALFASGSVVTNLEAGNIGFYKGEMVDVTGDGTLFTARFRVRANAKSGSYTIALGLKDNERGNLINATKEQLLPSFASGKITIKGKEDGDKTDTNVTSKTTVTDDGAVTIIDGDVPLGSNPLRLIITVDTGGKPVSKIETKITSKQMKDAAASDSEYLIKSDLGDILLPDKAVAALAKTGKDISVKLSKIGQEMFTVTVAAGGETIGKIDGGIVVAIPVANPGSGIVAIIIHSDGTEEVVRKSYIKDGKLVNRLPGSVTIRITDNGKYFDDVKTSDWFSDAVRFASSHELFQGTGGNKFSPQTPMTRGMLVTVLHRLENEPATTGELFSDVGSDKYYAKAVLWASANGIVEGVGGGKFAPDTDITCEQLAAIMFRYASSVGLNTYVRGSLAQFGDTGKVSAYATDAVEWAVGVGLIQGIDGNISPQGKATRAQVATILQRFIAFASEM